MHGVAGLPKRSVTPCSKPNVRIRGVRLSPVHSSNEYKNWGHSLTRVAGSNRCESKKAYALALVAIQVHLCKPELGLTRL